MVFLIYLLKYLCPAWKVNLTTVEPGGLVHGSIPSAWFRVSPTLILYEAPSILERTDEHLLVLRITSRMQCVTADVLLANGWMESFRGTWNGRVGKTSEMLAGVIPVTGMGKRPSELDCELERWKWSTWTSLAWGTRGCQPTARWTWAKFEDRGSFLLAFVSIG